MVLCQWKICMKYHKPTQGISQAGKNSAFCMIWEIKCNWGFMGHCEPFVSLIGGPGGKALGKFRIFCAMIVTDKLREI